MHYIAKFGIKESPKVEKISENTYRIILPEYRVIGFELEKDNPYQLYDTREGLLSYSTQDVDTGSLVIDSLSNEEQLLYLKRFIEPINSSAKSYYETLFKAFEEDIAVEVVCPNTY